MIRRRRRIAPKNDGDRDGPLGRAEKRTRPAYAAKHKVRERKCVCVFVHACTGARHVWEPVRGARLLLYGTRVFYAPRSIAASRAHRRRPSSRAGRRRRRRQPSRHRPLVSQTATPPPPPRVIVGYGWGARAASSPHVVQVWNSNNPTRMLGGGGGRGSSVVVWSKVGFLCGALLCLRRLSRTART